MKVEIRNNMMMVTTDYSSIFVSGAKRLGGRWDQRKKSWLFDAKDEVHVRNLLKRVYGTDGLDEPELVRVRLDLYGYYNDLCAKTSWIEMFGRILVDRKYSHMPPMVHDSATVIQGGFADQSDISAKRELEPKEGTILEIRDVPRQLAEDEMIFNPYVEIIEEKINDQEEPACE